MQIKKFHSELTQDLKKYKFKTVRSFDSQKNHYLNNSSYYLQETSKKNPIKKNYDNSLLWSKRKSQKSGFNVAQIYNQFHADDGNMIWSGITSLAIKDFNSHFLNKHKLQFKDPNPRLENILKALNNSTFSTQDVNQNSIYVKSGTGVKTIKSINKEVMQKFPNKKTPPLSQDGDQSYFITYAYLFKALQYKHPFERQPGMLWFGQPKPGVQNDKHDKNEPYMVQGFAAMSKQCLQQIKLIEYHDAYTFILGFKAKQMIKNRICVQNLFLKQSKVIKEDRNEQQKQIGNVIYILSFNQKQSHHSQDIKSVIQKIKQIQQTQIDKRPINQNLVQFMMPVIDFAIEHQFDQFKGKQIKNKELQGKNIRMIEHVNLRMDQKGVVIQEDAFIGKDQCAILGNIQIIVNQPFWLVLTQEGKHPYFVGKINSLPQKKFKEVQSQDNYYFN